MDYSEPSTYRSDTWHLGCQRIIDFMEDRPVTRAELHEALGATRTELLEALAATRIELLERLGEALAAQKDEIVEAIRDSQTEILKAFLTFQETSNIRFRAVEAKLSNTDAGLSERMTILERRLQEIEKRLLLNPPAASALVLQ